jgi:hypothetical protein
MTANESVDDQLTTMAIHTETSTSIALLDSQITTNAMVMILPHVSNFFVAPVCGNNTNCSFLFDPCKASQPCQHESKCNHNNQFTHGYVCQCLPGYSGYNCEHDDRPCKPETCWNNGRLLCYVSPGLFSSLSQVIVTTLQTEHSNVNAPPDGGVLTVSF